MSQDVCLYCKSTNISKGVRVSTEQGSPGMVYTDLKPESNMLEKIIDFGKTTLKAPIVADICDDCGSIRFWTPTIKKNWVKDHRTK